jgi:hypothetical protein
VAVQITFHRRQLVVGLGQVALRLGHVGLDAADIRLHVRHSAGNCGSPAPRSAAARLPAVLSSAPREPRGPAAPPSAYPVAAVSCQARSSTRPWSHSTARRYPAALHQLRVLRCGIRQSLLLSSQFVAQRVAPNNPAQPQKHRHCDRCQQWAGIRSGSSFNRFICHVFSFFPLGTVRQPICPCLLYKAHLAAFARTTKTPGHRSR